MHNAAIDHGKAFDWGKTSKSYAKYRDIYPEEFYERVYAAGIGLPGQEILDLGTGTGVLPRHMARYGAHFTGVDLSENQIAEARRLTAKAGLSVDYRACPAEEIDFPDGSFDAVTACQCFCYFDRARLLPRLAGLLKPGGRLCILYMNWLPEEDPLAKASEELVLRYNPDWTGAGYLRETVFPPEWGREWFETERAEAFDLQVPFTRESWDGRMRACRGIEASLPPEQVAAFEKEHRALLEKTAPEQFSVLHQATMLVLKKK